jgi:hypothetical protein
VRACVLIDSVCCLSAAVALRVNESGDVITVMLDFTAGTISFAKNGVCPGYGVNVPLHVLQHLGWGGFFTICGFVILLCMFPSVSVAFKNLSGAVRAGVSLTPTNASIQIRWPPVVAAPAPAAKPVRGVHVCAPWPACVCFFAASVSSAQCDCDGLS